MSCGGRVKGCKDFQRTQRFLAVALLLTFLGISLLAAKGTWCRGWENLLKFGKTSPKSDCWLRYLNEAQNKITSWKGWRAVSEHLLKGATNYVASGWNCRFFPALVGIWGATKADVSVLPS